MLLGRDPSTMRRMKGHIYHSTSRTAAKLVCKTGVSFLAMARVLVLIRPAVMPRTKNTMLLSA